MLLRCVLAVTTLLAGCATFSGAADGVADVFAAAAKAMKHTPYDAPGTLPYRLSDEVVGALSGAADVDPALAPETESAARAQRDIRRYRIEQAQAVAQATYDRAWLAAELGKLEAAAGNCDRAQALFQRLVDDRATPDEQRLAAQAELERIDLGVCWTAQKWTGYRYRPAPKYPRKPTKLTIQGHVELLLYVTASGSVRDVAVLRSDYKMLELYAVHAVRQWRYQPFVVDGRKIPRVARERITFSDPVIILEE